MGVVSDGDVYKAVTVTVNSLSAKIVSVGEDVNRGWAAVVAGKLGVSVDCDWSMTWPGDTASVENGRCVLGHDEVVVSVHTKWVESATGADSGSGGGVVIARIRDSMYCHTDTNVDHWLRCRRRLWWLCRLIWMGGRRRCSVCLVSCRLVRGNPLVVRLTLVRCLSRFRLVNRMRNRVPRFGIVVRCCRFLLVMFTMCLIRRRCRLFVVVGRVRCRGVRGRCRFGRVWLIRFVTLRFLLIRCRL